jgi:demethylmenaquinone methyltransferase/2-methoxy-6-polyprenyl-1,4-benzoquinol methylase
MTKSLDLGCGSKPRNFFNAEQVYGIDIRDDLEAGIYKADLVIEPIPFPDNYFNTVVVGFGLRNMNNKDQALCEMRRVLKPGGQVLVLEFSKIESETQNSTVHHYMQKAYDLYSLNVLPFFGKIIAGDEESYRYLAESIKLHPSQEELKDLMISCGFCGVEYENLTQGIVAIHRGYK